MDQHERTKRQLAMAVKVGLMRPATAIAILFTLAHKDDAVEPTYEAVRMALRKDVNELRRPGVPRGQILDARNRQVYLFGEE